MKRLTGELQIRDYKVESRSSTVLGHPGREYDWSLFDWAGGTKYKGLGIDAVSNKPYVDDFLIAPGCQYLHVAYDFAENCTIYRVRPNSSMYTGRNYRGRLVVKQEAVVKADGWYWRLTTKSLASHETPD
ncbi:MAG: hypothetical protein V3S68_09745 [Dehalococcoidia bacterium]